jgi:hypothetical protein
MTYELLSCMNKRCLRSVADIVKAFGGTKRTAEWANTHMSAVSNWLANNEIPNGWHYRMHLELTARGFEIDPRAFGIQVTPERRTPKQRASRPGLDEAGRAGKAA